MQALKIYQHGDISNLVTSEIPVPVPDGNEVLVEILAAGINPSDSLSARGGFPHSRLPRILGRDFAGRVIDGPAELIGQEIWGSGGDLGIVRDGTHAEYLVIPTAAVSLRPINLTAEEAAAVGVPFLTAWVALIERGGLKPGEWVVISGATGAVGAAAIQIAAAIGAKTIALVRNEDDDRRIDQTKVAAIAHLESNDLPKIVSELTGGKGAELAVNGIGVVAMQPLLDSLAEFGRLSLYSVLSGSEATMDLKQIYRNNTTIYGVNTAAINVTQGARILDQLTPLFESGAIKPPKIAGRYALSRAAEAYQNIPFGKTILLPDYR